MSAETSVNVLFSSAAVTLGFFCCRPHDPEFVRRSVAGANFMAIAHGSTAVRLWRPGLEPRIGTAVGAAFYERGEEYAIQLLQPNAIERTWFVEFNSAVLSPKSSCAAAFEFRHTRCKGDVYRDLHRIAALARNGDALGVEEALINCLEQINATERAHRTTAFERRRDKLSIDARRFVRWTQELLAVRFREALSLEAIAKKIGVSIYHLCHIFKAETGQSIHAFRESLRVRSALCELADAGARLIDVGYRHGFSSQSHFTDAFRRQLQISPGKAQRLLRGELKN